MSARYFQFKSGEVEAVRSDSARGAALAGSSSCTEVRVVPLDAEVITPGSSRQQQIDAWEKVAEHPFFADCYKAPTPMIDAVLAKLDEIADAIVIRPDELPKVLVNENRGGVDHGHLIVRNDEPFTYEEFDPTLENPDELRRRARAFLAAANHLEQHPPVDEEQVQEFSAALIEVEMDHPDGPVPGEVARRLVAAGYRIERVGGESR